MIVIEEAHAEAARPFGHLQADAAQADDAQASAVYVLAQQHLRLPRLPASLAGIAVGLHHAPGSGHEQGEGEVGGGLGQDAGRICNQDGALGSGGHVDVVVAYRQVTDHPQAGRRIHKLGVDAFGEEGEQAVGGRCLAQKDVAGRRQLLPPDAHGRRLSYSFNGVAG